MSMKFFVANHREYPDQGQGFFWLIHVQTADRENPHRRKWSTLPMRFASEESAMAWIREHSEEIFGAPLSREA